MCIPIIRYITIAKIKRFYSFTSNAHLCFLVRGNHIAQIGTQGRSKWSGWSGFGWTTISESKNKIPFYKKQVINSKIFGLSKLIIL